jgi:O-antigen/teichoic acid export membrane protein
VEPKQIIHAKHCFLENGKGDYLPKEPIRTHYSGGIIFGTKLISIAVSIASALIIANYLSKQELGVYGVFNFIVPYFTLLSGAISFWAMRFVARDKPGATKTGIAANTAIAIVATLAYLAMLPIIVPSFRLESYVVVYVVTAAQVIEAYLINVLEACLQAERPHFVGYGSLIGDVTQTLFTYIFVIQLQLGVLGVMLSVVIGFGLKIGFYFKTIVKELRQKLELSYVKEWLKGSTFTIYTVIGNQIASILFILLAQSQIGTSYYVASAQITNIIAYTTFLAFALYPKILAENKIEETTASMKLVLMFAIPMTAAVIAIPGSYLIFLKLDGEYVVAAPVLTILAIDALISVFSSILTSVLYGIEKVDEKSNVPFKQVTRSRLFIAFSLPYAQSAITLPAAFYALTYLARGDPLLIATYIVGINAIGHFAMLLVIYRVLSKAVKINIPWKSIGKYATSAAIMALVLFVTHPERRTTTLIITGVGAVVYFGLLLALDKETRNLARPLLQWIGSRMKKPGSPR